MEIAQIVEYFPEVFPYVILDDNDGQFLPEQHIHVIRIDPEFGLTMTDAFGIADYFEIFQ